MFSIIVTFFFLGINVVLIPIVYKLVVMNIKAWVDFSNTLVKYSLKKGKKSKTVSIEEIK